MFQIGLINFYHKREQKHSTVHRITNNTCKQLTLEEQNQIDEQEHPLPQKHLLTSIQGKFGSPLDGQELHMLIIVL